MTTASQRNVLNRRQVLALRGLRLPSPALKLLREAGIYCEPAISIEYQNLARRYVIWGRESGGAVAQVGAYCGFVDVKGNRLEWLSRVDAVGRNGIHATVVAPSLVRVQVFSQRAYIRVAHYPARANSEGGRKASDTAKQSSSPWRQWNSSVAIFGRTKQPARTNLAGVPYPCW
jgi:hypothetical protein